MQITKMHGTLEGRGGFGALAVDDVGFFFQNVADAFGRGQCLRKPAGIFGIFAYRTHGVLKVRNEYQQVTGGERAGQHLQGALPQHQGGGHGHQQVDRALQPGGQPLGVHVGMRSLAVVAVKEPREAVFQHQRLHGADGRHRFRRRGGQRAFAGALAAAGLVNQFAAAFGREPHHRQRNQRQQCQPPVQHEHHGKHAHQDEHVGQHRQQGRHGHFTQLAYVVDQAQGQITTALTLVKGQ